MVAITNMKKRKFTKVLRTNFRKLTAMGTLYTKTYANIVKRVIRTES